MEALRRRGRARQALALALLFALPVAVVVYARSARLERADLVMNNAAEITTMDPATVSGVPEGRVVRAIFEGLCIKDPLTLEPIPGMAERWELSADGRTYTFHLRADARWTNGDPVTAHDFVYSWERMLHPLTAAEYAYQLWYVKGARQYTLLVDDLLYQPDWTDNVWVEPLPGGRRVRVGLSGYQLEALSPDRAPRPTATAGQELTAGEAFAALGGERFHVPLGGLVTAVNAGLPASAGELRADPYGGWMIELEVGAGAVEGALERGELLPGEAFRQQLVFPERVGIRALDERVLEVELAQPTPYFLDLVAFYPLFPVNPRNIEEAQERWPGSWRLKWLRPENLVTNGPFQVAFRRVNDRIRLIKNPGYWDADNVAIETFDLLAVDRLGTSLNLYLTGEVDWIDRPITNVVPRLMPREDFSPAPYLGSYFYRVNVTRPPFDDPRLRRALALTIDRRAICEKVTKAGEGPAWSLVPPVLEDYALVELEAAASSAQSDADYEAAFARDVARAAELLTAAGYGPGGRELPTIEIHYNTDETHKDVAEVIGDGWKRHLGLNVKYLNQEWKVYLDSQKTFDYDVSRSAWIGDYPDPNTFLDMFLTGGENNRTGWGDPRYDALVRGAAAEVDPERRTAMLAEAEALLMEELPILPIYYYVTRNLVNPRLGGFHENFQDEHFPKFLYWMDDEELAAKRARLPGGRILVEARGPSAGQYSPAQQRLRAGD